MAKQKKSFIQEIEESKNDLSGANLMRANLEEANLVNANLRNAKLMGALSHGR